MDLKEFFIKNKAYFIFFFVLFFSGCILLFVNIGLTLTMAVGPCNDGVTMILLPFAYLIHGILCNMLAIYFIYFLIFFTIGALIIFLIRKRNTFSGILIVIIFSIITGSLAYSWQDSKIITLESEQIIKNEETGYFEYSLTETIGKYEIVQKGGFDFIEIEGFEQMNSQIALPSKRFEIPLPKNAEIKEIIVERSNLINLGKLNIPAINDGPAMPGVECYIEASDSIGLFNETHNNFTNKESTYTDLIIDILPVTYNTVSDEAILYKKISAKIIYKIDKSVILLRASPGKQYYKSDETINTYILLKNVTDKKVSVDIVNELRSWSSKKWGVIVAQNKKVEIESLATKEVIISLKAPFLEDGGGRVYTTVSHNQNIIGELSEHINVDSGVISNFKIRNFIRGNEAEFEITFSNQSKSEVEAAFGLILFQGSTQHAEFMPIVYRVSFGANQTHTFFWDIPKDFARMDYSAVATITVNGYVMSESKDITLKESSDNTQINTDTNTEWEYKSKKYGFSIASLPIKVSMQKCSFDENIKLYKPTGGGEYYVEIKALEWEEGVYFYYDHGYVLEGGKEIYLDNDKKRHTFGYEKCYKKYTMEDELLNRVSEIDVWNIRIKNVDNEEELLDFIKERYGDQCVIGGKTLNQNNIYDVGINCQTHSVSYVVKYSPQSKKAATWRIGSDNKFFNGQHESLDRKIEDSFQFIEI